MFSYLFQLNAIGISITGNWIVFKNRGRTAWFDTPIKHNYNKSKISLIPVYDLGDRTALFVYTSGYT